jgi:diaminopimelate epimerase
MKKIEFTKIQGSGNDFIILDGSSFSSIVGRRSSIVKICDRSYGIGADGILLLERSKKADVRMRIFNADGSQAAMCGNGARCCALYMSRKLKTDKLSIETKAGIVEAGVDGCDVKVKLTDPADIKFDLHVNVGGKDLEVDYINTGVPHAVIEVSDLENMPVKEMGRAIRHHELFKPAGTNVDFAKVIDKTHISVRTYERGVEDETLACGTGSVAAAIITVLNHRGEQAAHLGALHEVFVKTRSKEVLKVYFKVSKKKIKDVWLQGRAKIVFTGNYQLA